jgi:hypothetical protein
LQPGTRIDIADAVCVINGIGDLECPTTEDAVAAAAASAESLLPASEIRSRRARLSNREPSVKGARPVADQTVVPPALLPRLTFDVETEAGTVRVPVRFAQGRDDGKPSGADSISAFNACLDIDTALLTVDAEDLDQDGQPDAVAFTVPSSHVPLVQLDLGRPDCEIQLSVLDPQRPSSALPSGLIAEITLRPTGESLTPNAVRAGDSRALSFADVLALSQRGQIERTGPAD